MDSKINSTKQRMAANARKRACVLCESKKKLRYDEGWPMEGTIYNPYDDVFMFSGCDRTEFGYHFPYCPYCGKNVGKKERSLNNTCPLCENYHESASLYLRSDSEFGNIGGISNILSGKSKEIMVFIGPENNSQKRSQFPLVFSYCPICGKELSSGSKKMPKMVKVIDAV